MRRRQPMILPLLRAALLAAFFVLGACAKSPGEPPVIGPDVVEVAPPTRYKEWWSAVSLCLGISANMGLTRFYISRTPVAEPSSDIRGIWATHRITITDSIFNTGSAAERHTVGHLMIHEIINSPDHPAAAFACSP